MYVSVCTPQTFNKKSPSEDEGLLILMAFLTFWWFWWCLLRVWSWKSKKPIQEFLREPTKKYLDRSRLRVSFLIPKVFLL